MLNFKKCKVNKKDLKDIFKENVQIDDEGMKKVTTFNIKDLENLGINDVSKFLEGFLDSENGFEFNDSCADYIKGFKYGETRTI